MKNTIRMLGFIALVAAMGICFAACGDDDDVSFVGTWVGDVLTVTCTATTWTAVYPGAGSWSGTYTPSGNTANFIETNGSNFGTATISGNTMTVISSYGNFRLTK
jgi:hypothetical protein